MATNEYRSFAAGPSANSMTPGSWAASSDLLENGFQSGLAKSQEVNTVLRQASVGAAGVAEFIASKGIDSLDDGDVSLFAQRLADAVMLHVAGLVPAGTVADMYARTAPAGWLELDGGIKLRSAYPALWAHAQAQSVVVADSAWALAPTMFGSGDGSTTFRLPDLRGIWRRGWDNGRGFDPGRSLGSYQIDQMPSHAHSAIRVVADTGPTTAGGTDPNVTSVVESPTNTGLAGDGSEVRVKNVALMVCIKY